MGDPDGPKVSTGRVRNLSVEDLALTPPTAASGASGGGGTTAPPGAPPTTDEPEPLDPSDPLLATINSLLARFGGVIFVGPPGTSKSHVAAAAAMSLAGSWSRVRFVQFHASYQYEDFVQGYVPKKSGVGFTLEEKHLMVLAEAADKEPNVTYVIVIDELSRGDAARIFGEALTYVEKTKRGLRFSLASGDEWSIPPNLVFLATMNPFDRGVDDVDAAFERRFAKIAMDPDAAICRMFLDDAGMDTVLAERVVAFFRYVNEQAAATNPQTALGHTYFLGMTNEKDLRELWEHQLRFFFDKAYRLDPRGREEVARRWDLIFAPPAAPQGTASAAAGQAPGGSATAATAPGPADAPTEPAAEAAADGGETPKPADTDASNEDAPQQEELPGT